MAPRRTGRKMKLFGDSIKKSKRHNLPVPRSERPTSSLARFARLKRIAKDAENPSEAQASLGRTEDIYKVADSNTEMVDDLFTVNKLFKKKTGRKTIFEQFENSKKGVVAKKKDLVAKSQANTATPKKIVQPEVAPGSKAHKPIDFKDIEVKFAFNDIVKAPPVTLPVLKRAKITNPQPKSLHLTELLNSSSTK